MFGPRTKSLRRIGLLALGLTSVGFGGLRAQVGVQGAPEGAPIGSNDSELDDSEGDWRDLDPLERELRVRRWAYEPTKVPFDDRTTLAVVQHGRRHWTWLYDRADALSRTPEGAQVPGIEGVWFWGHDPAYPSLQRAVDQVQRWLDQLGRGRSRLDDSADFWVESDLDSEWGVQRWNGLIENTVLYSEQPSTWSALNQSLLGPVPAVPQERWQSVASALALQAPRWGREALPWFQREGGRLHLERLQAEHPSMLHLPLSQEFLEGLRELAVTPEERFTVEALVLARGLREGPTGDSVPLTVQREDLHQGWLHWRDAHGAVWPWQVVDARKDFLDRVARLGDETLGAWLWETAGSLDQHLAQAEWEALGGLHHARQDFFAWACESLAIDDVLQRAHALSTEDAQWIFDTCLARLGNASLPQLRSWTEPGWPVRIREQALAGVLKHPEGPTRRALIRGLWEDEDFALVRASMRASREWTLSGEESTQIARAWSVWDPERRLALLRWMRPEALPDAIAQECARWLQADPHADPYLIEVVSKRLPAEAVRPLLRAGWRRDFAVAQARWTAPEGSDPNAGVVRLTAWLTGLARVDRPALLDGWAQDWLQRVVFLADQNPERPSYVLGKAMIAQLAGFEAGRVWLRERSTSAWAWPRRLRVELALQLAPYAHEEDSAAFARWLRTVHAEDYRGLGVVLRERWWKAIATRPEEWQENLIQVASDARAAGTVREAAMRTLAARGAWEPLFAILAGERPGEGVWLAAEVLAERADAAVGEALRARLALAVQRVQSGAQEAELSEETLVALQIALVQAGQWTAEDARSLLFAPNLRHREALQQRLRGATKPEHWPREMRLCAHLAAQKRLADAIDRDPERWLRLPGPYLASLAEMAWIGRDLEATARLARMAEIAVAGEAADLAGRDAHITVQRVRFLLAWQTEDWPLARAYSLRLWHLVQQGGQGARRLESTLGVLDWRRGVDPGAALAAGSWQAGAWAALEAQQVDSARRYARRAAVWTGRSQVAQDTQRRLEDALASVR